MVSLFPMVKFSLNNRVRKLLWNGEITTITGGIAESDSMMDRNGVITTIAGTGKRGFKGDGQLATSARMFELSNKCISIQE